MRERYKKIRLLTSPRSVEEDSVLICRKVFREIDWSKVKKCCAYSPIDKLKEVGIRPLIETIAYKYPDIKITVLAPSKAQKVPRIKFDLIIVPMLAFDKDNYRLGFGGGFYDRFLARQPQALKIGVCFHNGFVKKGLSHEAHDVPLDKIITEV